MKNQGFTKIAPPVSIERIKIYRDGGSIGVELIDSSGMNFIFCVDGRIRSNTRDHLYINAIHPTKEGAQVVSKGAEEGDKIVDILQSYLDDKFSKEKQAELQNAYGKRKLNEEERVGALSINVIDRLRNPRG